MYITPIQCRNESIIINIFNKNVNLKKKDLKKKIKVLNHVKNTHKQRFSISGDLLAVRIGNVCLTDTNC